MRGEQYFEKRLIEEAEQKRVSTVWFGVLIRLIIITFMVVVGVMVCNYTVDTYQAWEDNPMQQ